MKPDEQIARPLPNYKAMDDVMAELRQWQKQRRASVIAKSFANLTQHHIAQANIRRNMEKRSVSHYARGHHGKAAKTHEDAARFLDATAKLLSALLAERNL